MVLRTISVYILWNFERQMRLCAHIHHFGSWIICSFQEEIGCFIPLALYCSVACLQSLLVPLSKNLLPFTHPAKVPVSFVDHMLVSGINLWHSQNKLMKLHDTNAQQHQWHHALLGFLCVEMNLQIAPCHWCTTEGECLHHHISTSFYWSQADASLILGDYGHYRTSSLISHYSDVIFSTYNSYRRVSSFLLQSLR